jgi:hypothetical protein
MAKAGHYQVACDRTFEGLFGERLDKLVEHPNEYLAASVLAEKKQQGAVAASPEARGNGRSSLASAVTATPMRGASTPAFRTPFTACSTQETSFVRTPINITPTLGGVTTQDALTSTMAKASCDTPGLSAGSPADLAACYSPIAGLQHAARK